MTTAADHEAAELLRFNAAYRAGKPLISDPEFDRREAAFKAANPGHPAIPFLRMDTDWQHGKTYPLKMWGGSQQKAMNDAETEALVRRYYAADPMFVSYKADGASCQINYVQGVLQQVLTKGNNIVGSDITAPTIHAVPATLPKRATKTVRGEVVLTKANLVKLNEELARDGLEPFVNTRNSVTAMLRSFDKYATYCHYLSVVVYDADYTEATTRDQMMLLLQTEGFDVLPGWVIDGNFATFRRLLDLKEVVAGERDRIPYDIDGLVVAPNGLDRAVLLGVSADRAYRNGEFAVKFDAEGAISTIKDIEWSAEGRNYISPIAIIDPPVQLAGASINRVSLKSPEWAETYKVGIGTVIRVERSGDVIPVIPVDRKTGAPLAGTIVDNTLHTLNTPTACPCCGHKAEREGARLACVNVACPAKEAADFVHFGASLGLKGIGHATALTWIAAGVSFADFIAGAADRWAAVEAKLIKSDDVSFGLWSNIRDQLNG